MTSRNDITGDLIKTKYQTDAGRLGWLNIWGTIKDWELENRSRVLLGKKPYKIPKKLLIPKGVHFP